MKSKILLIIVMTMLIIIIPSVYSAVGGLNIVQSSATYVYDITFPNLTIINPTENNGSIITRNWTLINVSMRESFNESIIINFNGTNYTNQNLTLINSSPKIFFFQKNFTNLTNGMYTFYAWTNDSAHNTNQTETRTISIFSTPPNFSISYPSNGSHISSPTLTTTVIIRTNEQSICEYGDSSFNFGSGTRFANTNSSTTTDHNTTLNTPSSGQDLTYNFYYICQNLGGVNSGRILHSFIVIGSGAQGSTPGGGGGGGGGSGDSGITITPPQQLVVSDIRLNDSKKQNVTSNYCNIKLSTNRVILSENSVSQQVVIVNYHNDTITPILSFGKTNTGIQSTEYFKLMKNFETIKSTETGIVTIIAINSSKNVTTNLEIQLEPCPTKSVHVEISNQNIIQRFSKFSGMTEPQIVASGILITSIIMIILLSSMIKD